MHLFFKQLFGQSGTQSTLAINQQNFNLVFKTLHGLNSNYPSRFKLYSSNPEATWNWAASLPQPMFSHLQLYTPRYLEYLPFLSTIAYLPEMIPYHTHFLNISVSFYLFPLILTCHYFIFLWTSSYFSYVPVALTGRL